MTTWLVTGATGFLGANLCSTLPGDVVGLTRSRGVLPWCAQVVQADLLDESSLRVALTDVSPDVVLNAAAVADHRACAADEAYAMRVNAEAAGALARITGDLGAAFVQISTDAVFDGRQGNYAESDRPNPLTAYGRTKLAGEHQVLDAYPQSLILRTNFFGWSPSGAQSTLEFFVNALSNDVPVNGFANYTVSSLWVDALTTAIADLVALGAFGLMHVASTDALSKDGFGRLVAAEFGLSEDLITAVQGELESGASAQDLSLSSGRAESMLGYKMLTQAEGIKQAHRVRASRSFR